MPFPVFPLQRQYPFFILGCFWRSRYLFVCTHRYMHKKAFLQEKAPPALPNPCAESSSPVGFKPACDKCAVILAAGFYFWGYQLDSYYESRKLELHLVADACDSITARNSSFLKLFN